jgi:hypothetical protein
MSGCDCFDAEIDAAAVWFSGKTRTPAAATAAAASATAQPAQRPRPAVKSQAG